MGKVLRVIGSLFLASLLIIGGHQIYSSRQVAKICNQSNALSKTQFESLVHEFYPNYEVRYREEKADKIEFSIIKITLGATCLVRFKDNISFETGLMYD